MKTNKILVFLIAFLILTTSVSAQNDVKFRRKSGRLLITLDVVNYPIKKLLKMIAEERKMDLIFSADVKGNFTGRFTDVSAEFVMGKILKSNQLDFEKLGNIYRIDTVGNLDSYRQKMFKIQAASEKAEPLETRVIRVNYVDLGSLQGNLMKLLSDRGSIVPDERTKKLIVTDIKEKFPIIYRFVQAIDIPTKQVLIKVKFVQISHTDLQNIEFYWTADNLGSSSQTKMSAGSYTGSSSEYPSAGAGLLRTGIVKNYMELEGVLNMLASENKAVVRSHPQILALNNEQATINIGNKIPLRMVDESGNLTTQLTYVGTQIKVTPQVTANNSIILQIHPEVSSIAGQFGSGVLIDTNQIDTSVVLKNKQTAVIGGLVKEETTENKGGVPFLSDIPFIGALFRSKEKSKTRIEILILVTPIIQETDNE